MATPIEPPEEPRPRLPWGARANRVMLTLLGVWTLWTLVRSLGDGLIAVPIAIAAFAVAAIGLLAIEITEALEKPEALLYRCADQSISTHCTDPWIPP